MSGGRNTMNSMRAGNNAGLPYMPDQRAQAAGSGRGGVLRPEPVRPLGQQPQLQQQQYGAAVAAAQAQAQARAGAAAQARVEQAALNQNAAAQMGAAAADAAAILNHGNGAAAGGGGGGGVNIPRPLVPPQLRPQGGGGDRVDRMDLDTYMDYFEAYSRCKGGNKQDSNPFQSFESGGVNVEESEDDADVNQLLDNLVKLQAIVEIQQKKIQDKMTNEQAASEKAAREKAAREKEMKASKSLSNQELKKQLLEGLNNCTKKIAENEALLKSMNGSSESRNLKRKFGSMSGSMSGFDGVVSTVDGFFDMDDVMVVETTDSERPKKKRVRAAYERALVPGIIASVGLALGCAYMILSNVFIQTFM